MENSVDLTSRLEFVSVTEAVFVRSVLGLDHFTALRKRKKKK